MFTQKHNKDENNFFEKNFTSIVKYMFVLWLCKFSQQALVNHQVWENTPHVVVLFGPVLKGIN
jgi:hypothetical protein